MSSQQPTRRRRLLVVTTVLLALVAGAVVTAQAADYGWESWYGADGRTKLYIESIGYTSRDERVVVPTTIFVGTNTTYYVSEGPTLAVGHAVALTISEPIIPDGITLGGFARCWKLGGWSHQPATGGNRSAESASAKVTFDGVSDIATGADHVLWLRYEYVIDDASSQECG